MPRRHISLRELLRPVGPTGCKDAHADPTSGFTIQLETMQ
jgi:hypothetical protein